MTPLQFEQTYQAEWEELEGLLRRIHGLDKRKDQPPIAGERVAALYRRCCEQLALAQARAYPAYLIDRLGRLTADAHQVIYHRNELGVGKLRRLVAVTFPQTVRRHAGYVWLSLAVFAIPLFLFAGLVYARPELILSVANAFTVAEYEKMYSPDAESIGRLRTANTDWQMFGFYIRHNITIAFQCFASGLFAGVGTLFFLAFNAVQIGAVMGFLTERGLGGMFYSFVATHGAFELTAIVLSGAAGLRIGHALIAPGPYTRTHALVIAAKDAVVIIYGVAVLLLIAAAVEAFWSSAAWIPLMPKYAVAAACWIAVLLYLTRQGRHAD